MVDTYDLECVRFTSKFVVFLWGCWFKVWYGIWWEMICYVCVLVKGLVWLVVLMPVYVWIDYDSNILRVFSCR